ncbi:MAG: CRTAC1 family protein, partial [Actinomycetota bacterium]|nr:CRTAC1 family protein [Actinomycetota bacterium]
TFQPIPGIHRLYRNNGDLTFTNVSAQTGWVNNLGFWMATAWGDYDNDSDLDHFSTSAGGSALQDVPDGPSTDAYFPHGFWENVGDGSFFQHKPHETGLARPRGSGFGWGANFADFDNDGFMDLFFHGTYPSLGGLLHDAEWMGNPWGNPGYLYRNTGDRRFKLVQTFGLRNRFTSGSAVGDFDGDGFPDIAVVNTAFRRDPGKPILLLNKTANGNGWITVRTVGTKSNRDGIGAKVRVLAGRLTKLQEVRSGSSFASMDSPWLTFGLGRKAPRRVSIEVTWPSGRVEVFRGKRTRRIVTLREGRGKRIRVSAPLITRPDSSLRTPNLPVPPNQPPLPAPTVPTRRR